MLLYGKEQQKRAKYSIFDAIIGKQFAEKNI